MSLGTLGSTLNDELNRLANGGTYRDSGAMVDEALAAKQWANCENISPYSTDTVGVLNEIAGLGLDKKNWLDYNGICNYIAGTSGLPAAAALRQIYPTTDLLTGVAAYYVDAIDSSASGQTITNLGTAGSLLPTTVGSSTAADSNDPIFLAHTGTNYVYVPGLASNLLTVPDATGFAVTDLDVRAQVALDDWTPAAIGSIASQYGAAGDRSWTLRILTTGILRLVWSNDGTATLSADSTVAPTVADGATLWVRATLDVDNGASGKDVKFFTSTNGSTWTQLGSTVTTAGTTTIFNSTGVLSIGGEGTTGLGVPLAGKVFRTQLMNAIDGTAVLDVDTSVITAGSATSFTAVTGQTVTINRSTSGRKTVAVTQPTWLFGTDDYMEVNNRYMAKPAGTGNYLYLPGIASNYASAPDAAVLDVTGDIDLRVKVALDDWTPSTLQYLVSKYQSGPQASYMLAVLTDGKLRFAYSTDGTTIIVRDSSVATGIADGSIKWVRATRVAATGVTQFFTSDDGLTWTQLGTDVSGTTGNIFASTAIIEVGAVLNGTTFPSRGKFFRAQVLNGIGGTVAFDANFENSITSLLQTSFTESSTNAATVTINRSGSTFRSAGVIDAGYLYPGATNTFTASATDFLNFGATDSFTALAVVRQWVLGTPIQVILAKRNGTGSDSGYALNSGSSTNNFRTIIISNGTSNSDSEPGVVGTLSSIAGTITPSLITTYTNAVTGGSTARSVGTLSSVDTLGIGRYSPSGSGTGYADMELVAAAVFRTVLTAAQIRQVTNYFANREVYL